MKKIKFKIRNFFGFSKKETNGFMLLVIILFFLLLIPFLFEKFYTVKEVSNRDKEMLDSLVAVYESSLLNKELNKEASVAEKNKTKLFYFNPNDASQADLKQIFGHKISRTIVNFRSKGGKFQIKKDLLKIYGIDSVAVLKIEKFILLPDIRTYAYDKKELKKTFDKPKAIELKAFDINEADSLTLRMIKGIGGVLSVRIIKYRNRLGGFIDEDQYKEVYGLDTSVVEELKKYSYIKKDFVPVKISINDGSFGILAAHPYMGKKNSNAIINFRSQHKKFNSLEELKLIRSIEPNELIKMLPYLKV